MEEEQASAPKPQNFAQANAKFKDIFIRALQDKHIDSVKLDGFVARLVSSGFFRGRMDPGVFSRTLHVGLNPDTFANVYDARAFGDELARAYTDINQFYGSNQHPYKASVERNGDRFVISLKDDDCYMEGFSLSDYYRIAGTFIVQEKQEAQAGFSRGGNSKNTNS